MSLSSPYQEHYYVADGVTTTFAFGSDFTALSSSYVKCIIYFDDGTNCVPTFNVDMTTGFISIVTLTKPDGTVLTVPPAGSIVRVFRDVPEQQNVTASQLQNYTAKQLEKIFDSVVAMIQEVSYSDLHKTIRLTETQRDVAVEQLTEEKDQAVLYWDFDSRTLKATDYGQDEIVKSETVDRLVYLQPEGKIYFIPKGSNNPVAIGSATIHNDLSGRNAPDCHPESAITNLTTHLQELRDRDTAIEYKADQALSKAGEALDTANHADANATYAVGLVNTFDGRLTQAESDASEAKEKAIDAKTTVDNHVLDYNNPHQVTKAQVGLGNCDNTSDEDKPISTATQDALDGLQDQIDDLSGRGRFLALWNCATGLAESNPPESPYTYQSGDYFIVGTVGATNYRPDGSSYTTGVASTTIETAEVKVDDVYLYDGTNWKLLASSQRTYTFAGIAGSPYDNTNLGNALNTKVDANAAISGATKCKITYDNKGLVTAGADLAEGDIPSLHLSKISDVTASASEVNVLDGITASTTELNYTDGVTSNIQTQIDGKQATISDLATIRSGASAGATAVQPSDLATVATSGLYSDLTGTPTIPTVNNPTITITQGGVTKGSFTLNQASGDTIALDAGGGGGSVDIDNSTITKNSDDEIQAVATVNANTSAGATNPIYDWVGTLSEYETLNIETLHPDWVCYITDDFTAQAYEAYTKSQTNDLLAGKVDKGHQVIEFQEPTALNNYTWYRKYADGWVEQGGEYTGNAQTITLPVVMATNKYRVDYDKQSAPAYWASTHLTVGTRTTTSFTVNTYGDNASMDISWQVSGMAA